MKQLSGAKQKWVLSLALLAVLGTQSYFQVSSNTLNSYELASREPAEALPPPKGIHYDPKSPTGLSDADAKKDEVKKDDSKTAAKPADAKVESKAEAKKEEKSDDKKDLENSLKQKDEKIAALEERTKKMEGTLTALGCKDGSCDSDFLTKIKALVNPITAVTDKAAEKKVVKAEHDCDQEETAKEKRECLADERKAKKEAAAEAKKEKEDAAAERALAKKEKKEAEEKEKRDDANEAFTDAMKDINESCVDTEEKPAIQCIAEKMSSLLQKVSKGSKDKKPDKDVVKKAFSEYFAKAFVASMKNPAFEMSGTLDAIMKDIPNEYTELKNTAMTAIANVTSAKAAEIKKSYIIAQDLKKQNMFAQANMIQEKANFQLQGLKGNSNTIYEKIGSDLTTAKDFSALDYLQTNYLTNVSGVLTALDKASNGIGLVDANGTAVTRANARGTSDILVRGNTLNNALKGNNQTSNGGSFVLTGRNIGDGVSVGTATSTQQIPRGSK